MRAGQWAVLVVVFVAAAGGAFYLFGGRDLFRGCEIHVASEASRDVRFQVDIDGQTAKAEGTIPPGESVDVKLCTLARRDHPPATLRVQDVGSMPFSLDPACSDWSFLVNDTAIVAASRACA